MGQVQPFTPPSDSPKALFDLAPLSPSQTACDDNGNLTQARYELHRARDFGTDGDLARWAERWGEDLIAAGCARVDLQDAIEASEADNDYSEVLDTTAVQDALNDAREEIVDIAKGLEVDADKLNLSDLRERAIVCRRAIENADSEVVKL